MPSKHQGANPQEMLEARLRWALESTLVHFLKRPDRNSIEDWAAATAQEITGEDLASYIRAEASTAVEGAAGHTAAGKNGKVTLPTK